jgi:hypothetical protein
MRFHEACIRGAGMVVEAPAYRCGGRASGLIGRQVGGLDRGQLTRLSTQGRRIRFQWGLHS